jgi:hypothetical protein
MALPDDLPARIFKNGQIDWSHSKSGLVNAYIEQSYHRYSNTQGPAETRNAVWVPESFVAWSRGLNKDFRYFLDRRQSEVEKLANGASWFESFQRKIS